MSATAQAPGRARVLRRSAPVAPSAEDVAAKR
jgi:hypothetical protein